jgi:diamine N-acetyltransferase
MQDRGFGTEAIQAFCRYCREKLGITRIVLRTRPYNPRAIHVYEKCGFREYDRTDEHICMERTL